MNPQEKIIKAKVALLQDHPFFGSIVCKWQISENPGIPTGWCNSKDLQYNPAWIGTLSLPKVKGFLAHEAAHIANAHHLRRQDRDPEGWNIATDKAINKVLLDNHFDLPDDGLYSSEDKSAEHHYDDWKKKPDPDGDEQGPGFTGQQGQDGTGTGNGDQSDDGAPCMICGDPGCNGECLDDDQQDGQDAPPDPGGCGAVGDLTGEDGQELSDAELKDAENENRVELAQAAQIARNAGRMPVGMDRLIEERLYPKLDFFSLLQRFVQRSARDNFSWTPPNRRFISLDILLPSLRSDSINLVIGADTSMSIGQAKLDLFNGAVNAILGTFSSVSVTVLYCDARIHGDPEQYETADLPINLEPKGGGGTDFRPVFNWIEENRIDPDCLIYLTDLYGPCPDRAPDYPVLWACITDEKAPFGETVKLE